MVPCELDMIYNPILDETIITYKLELITSGNIIGFNLLDDDKFTIPYIIFTITNSPDGNKIPTWAKKNVLIIDISGE